MNMEINHIAETLTFAKPKVPSFPKQNSNKAVMFIWKNNQSTNLIPSNVTNVFDTKDTDTLEIHLGLPGSRCVANEPHTRKSEVTQSQQVVDAQKRLNILEK